MRVLLLIFCAVVALEAQKPPEPAKAPAMSKKMQELVERARSVPPEFSADALLRIAESDAVTDSGVKKELIEEAFRKAGGAQEPMKRKGLRPGGGDTRATFQARAFAQE